MKNTGLTKNLTSIVLAGATALMGCNKAQEDNLSKSYSNRTIVLTSAKKVIIEPQYENMFMKGITVTKVSQNYEIEKSKTYVKGSSEYEALRPLLTVEQIK